MKTIFKHAIAAIALFTQSVAASAQGTDWGRASAQLQLGMTEQVVTVTIGSPRATEMTTCGINTGAPWQCKVYRYGNVGRTSVLIIEFQSRGNDWVVQGWSVTPPPRRGR